MNSRYRQTDLDLLMENSMPEPNSGCWLWLMSVDRYGYGQWTRLRRGKRVKAHRVAYETRHGVVPLGSCVCHKCDVPSCVNPDHLWLGSVSDNNADKAHKGRQSKGSLVGTSKLTETLALQIRIATTSLSATAKAFGVSKTLVQQIRQRRVWAHV